MFLATFGGLGSLEPRGRKTAATGPGGKEDEPTGSVGLLRHMQECLCYLGM
jgi:hypothetical protein